MQRLIFMLLLFGVLAITTTHSRSVIIKRYAEPEEGREQKVAEAQAPDSIKKGSKYFQDIYSAQNSPYELEFGHVKETPDEWEQRFEKADFNKNVRQGKVRWGDKDGGYGEQYWDFNHAGANEDEEGEKEEQETQQQNQYVDQDQTQNADQQGPQQNVEQQPPQSDPRKAAKLKEEEAAKESDAALLNSRIQRQTNDAEFINDEARQLYKSGRMQKHGGNYRREEDEIIYERAKRENKLGDIELVGDD